MKYLIVIFALILFSSCQEEVVLDLDTLEPIPVIEAIWTDNSAINQVKITLSKDYYQEGDNEVVENADVSIRNIDSGGVVIFFYSPANKKYLAQNGLRGIVGQRYELSVRIEDKVYLSNGTILPPPVLDSVVVEFKDERLFRDEGYYLTVYGKIPFTENNNYRIRIVENDTLKNSRFDYLLFDDSFGTAILDDGFELSGFPFKANDKIRLELFRLNQSAFDYLNQFVSLLFNDGGLFSPPPQNPQSNIRQENGDGPVLGYFMTSPVLIETVLIPDDQP
ncbi:DUF4249 domain-containing protein [Aquiflexum gelatinilyticum]|uniref:DUF4249 domain-containing protein n=1 Tax=Aquiflexum gelatinilyticum TaxID=2961943 RepID=A0A9X2P4Z1_9BACT|nr:DUF4249 domain-containing protein [Aquiflexum gelatinilyticum]MCR9014926.1 DUF4249 domain-containing protein [Aquiflexum gelatinilyticum]